MTQNIHVYLVLERLTNVSKILRKDLYSIPSAKMLEENSLLEEIKDDVNIDEIWMTQYKA